jgi:nucleotide-binding universal stress UspA family protein
MKILLGYDGSGAAGDALALAVKYAKAFNAGVDVVSSLVEGTEEEIKDIAGAEKRLEIAREHLEKEKIECRTHLLIRGLSAGEDIISFAVENKADLIIIGIRRRSKVGKLVFGSTAQYVILNAPCPVVSVK